MQTKKRYREDSLTEKVIQCIIAVHAELGPGFVEKIYRNALLVECKKQGLRTETEKEIIVYYDGVPVGKHRLDILIQDILILELKTVEELGGSHYAQVRSYLKAAGLKPALLVNFSKEKADFRRVELQ